MLSNLPAPARPTAIKSAAEALSTAMSSIGEAMSSQSAEARACRRAGILLRGQTPPPERQRRSETTGGSDTDKNKELSMKNYYDI